MMRKWEAMRALEPPPADPVFDAQALAERLGLDADARGYLDSHARRLAATAALVPQTPGLDVLEIGTAEPFPLLAHLAARQGLGQIAVAMEPDPLPRLRPGRLILPDGGDRAVTVAHTDIDAAALPFAAESFDCVLALEILEHLIRSPLTLLREAARVLRPGGHLVLTTPNLVATEALARMLAGDAPYHFGLYDGSLYGRHNREYAPVEVAEVAEAVGFETETLATADLYPPGAAPHWIAAAQAALAASGAETARRGQHLLYRGIKRRFDPRGWPRRLFAADPTARAAGLRLEAAGDGESVLALHNRGDAPWDSGAAFPVLLAIAWLEGAEADSAQMRADHGRLALPRPVAPGETIRLALPVGAAAAEAEGWVRIGLVEEFRAFFETGGYGETVTLPASRAQFAALATAGHRGPDGVTYTPPLTVAREVTG